MRILAIGDIHGHSGAFDALIAAVKPKLEDIIVTLGDYVDRGPDSKGVINRLIALHETGQLVALRGNHELMMLRSRDFPEQHESRWQKLGGKATLASYSKSGKSPKIKYIPDEHWHFIENICVDWWESDEHFFVHAGVAPHLSLTEQSEYELFWEKFNNPMPHCSGKTMVCGHTSQKNGKPLNIGHAICIDTRVYDQGWLSCLDIASGKLWQANKKGKLRTTSIYDFETIR
ncbi:MAG: metallophosphoesterase family protein [Microcoleaceae cyanobacterium MO_207.B10]|nr:metallophosphoesterase family protein [Microcoleaceae cyanobacterium MO_207.B10]